MVGWREELREPIIAALNTAGFENPSVQTDGGWAKIFKITNTYTEELGGNTL